MIHQRKINTELGGGVINLDASLDADIDFEFFDSRGITGKKNLSAREQRYRSNLTVRQCASVDLREFRNGLENGHGNGKKSCRKTRSLTQGISVTDGNDLEYSNRTPTPSLASSKHGRSASASRTTLDIIAEASESRLDVDQDETDDQEEKEDQKKKEDRTNEKKAKDDDASEKEDGKDEKRDEKEDDEDKAPSKTSSSPDIRGSRSRLARSTESLTNSMSCVSLLDNGLRTHFLQKPYKNGTRHSMSFTNERFREIERVNQILLKKIMDKKRSHPILQPSPRQQRFLDSNYQDRERYLENRRVSAEINRRKLQRQIDIENAKLDRRIRQAKPVTKTRR